MGIGIRLDSPITLAHVRSLARSHTLSHFSISFYLCAFLYGLEGLAHSVEYNERRMIP